MLSQLMVEMVAVSVWEESEILEATILIQALRQQEFISHYDNAALVRSLQRRDERTMVTLVPLTSGTYWRQTL